ncbi:MAG: Fic family protein [Streptosporangiales bacterium]|nr:Fic family protein [Streptosporangiales bacterium]
MAPSGRPSRVAIYRRLDEAVGELRDRFGGLPTPTEAADIWVELWHQEAHNSTAIEGNTLVPREVQKLLDEGTVVGGKPLREYLEVRGYGDAATWVYRQALAPDDWHDGELVCVQDVRHVHHLCMTPLWTVEPHTHAGGDERPGDFRRHEIAPFSAGTKPPSWTDVEHQLNGWVDATNGLRRGAGEPLPEALARVHGEFERIHPFLDGNGRAGRLMLNLILVRLGYPPAIIYKRDRDAYLRGLRKADAGDFGPLGELVARSVTANLHRFVLPAVAGPAELVPLAATARGDLSENALRMAAIRGRLRAVKGDDGMWRTTVDWVRQYRESRYRRGL